MKFECEITVEVDTSLENLQSILVSHGFQLKEIYDINDIYMINKNDLDITDNLEKLSKCVLIRDIIDPEKNIKMLTYKYKEFNDKKEIIKQGKVKCNIDDVENAKLLFEKLNFEELIRIYDHSYVYANETDELTIQSVNEKHLYIEIEDECSYIDKKYSSLDELKSVITKYNIPIKGDNYFVKKAEIELSESVKKLNR